MVRTELKKRVTVNGHTFELMNHDDHDDRFYEARGEIMYDDDHDQTPEPSLWEGAKILSERLDAQGYKTDYNHSEKGYVEVYIENDN